MIFENLTKTSVFTIRIEGQDILKFIKKVVVLHSEALAKLLFFTKIISRKITKNRLNIMNIKYANRKAPQTQKISKFWSFLDTQITPKLTKMRSKMIPKIELLFLVDFYRFWSDFGVQNGAKIMYFFDIFHFGCPRGSQGVPGGSQETPKGLPDTPQGEKSEAKLVQICYFGS